MDELKPCPHCGGKADLYECHSGFSIFCPACDTGIIDSNWTESKAVEIWNTRADGWVSAGKRPKCSGRYTVNSSYGVRDAFFSEGFIVGDFRWQDCETGNDEGVENHHGIEFEVYNWMPSPAPPKAEK